VSFRKTSDRAHPQNRQVSLPKRPSALRREHFDQRVEQKGKAPVEHPRAADCHWRLRSKAAAQHIPAVRADLSDYTLLLHFCRKVDRRLVTRHDLILLIELGAFGFTE
jgi:hypothetical protein